MKYGKPVLVMEPIKGGMLANVPAEAEALLKGARPEMSVASWAIRFAASQENVFMVLSGMSDEQQVEDNLSYMKDFAPLSDEEKDLVAKSAAIIKSKEKVPCTGCRYCTDRCPMKIANPGLFQASEPDQHVWRRPAGVSQIHLQRPYRKRRPRKSI